MYHISMQMVLSHRNVEVVDSVFDVTDLRDNSGVGLQVVRCVAV